MHELAVVLPMAAVVALIGQHTRSPAVEALSALSEHFVCPESLPTKAARQDAFPNFVHAYEVIALTHEQDHSAATSSRAKAYWRVLLKTHDCQPEPRLPVTIGVFTGPYGYAGESAH
jgi:hypothetical protein